MGRVPRLPLLCAALLIAAPAWAQQDQPKNQPDSPPAAAKPKQAAPAPANPATTPPPHVETPKRQADSLLGKEVYGADGKQMGLVTNVLIDRNGKPIALVIDFGGFLGVGTRKIAIDWHLMQFHPGDKDKPVTLSLSKDQLKSAPEYRPDKSAAPVIYAPAPAPLPKPLAKTPSEPASKTPPPEPDHNGPK